MPDDPKYVEYLEELFGRKFDDVRILTPFICDFGNRVKFGKNVFINHSAILWAVFNLAKEVYGEGGEA